VGPKSNDKCPYKRHPKRGEILVKMEADIGGSNHKSRPTDSHQKLEEARNRISPGVSEGKRVLC
jgi:hypothetical protein